MWTVSRPRSSHHEPLAALTRSNHRIMTTTVTNTRSKMTSATLQPPPAIDRRLLWFLTTWGVDFIGNGDEAAGLNTLVGLCGILANVAGPDAVLIDQNDDSLAVGMNWIVTGGVSCDLLRSIGLGPLTSFQSALLGNASHLRELARLKEERDSELPPARREKSEGLTSLEHRLQLSTANLQMASSVEALLEHSDGLLDEIREKPLVFVEGSATKMLQNNLARCHRGHAYVCLSPVSPTHFSDVESVFHAMRAGRQLDDGTMIRGYSTILTSAETFARSSGEQRDSIGNELLVLAETPLPGVSLQPKGRKSRGIEKRFDDALQRVLNSRLSSSPNRFSEDPVTGTIADARPAIKVEWRECLHGINRTIAQDQTLPPGTPAVAARVFASLAFGLSLMSDATRPRLPCQPYDVAHLTMYLVRRSVHAQRRIREQGESERILRIARKCLEKLAAGPCTARDLCQCQSNKVVINDCRRALALTIKANRVEADGPINNASTRFSLVNAPGVLEADDCAPA